MKRKTFYLKIKVVADIEDGISIDNVVSNLDYEITHPGEEATVIDTEITDFNEIESE